MEGGLNFKNLSNQNIAMGAKLLWRIIAPKSGWAQLALWKKYFRGQRARCLDKPKITTGTMIHKLCEKASALINLHAHWIPGNGKRIQIWEDRIMGSDPLGDDRSLVLLKEWMDKASIKTPWDLSHWENDVWKADIRGWGPTPRSYTVSQGYRQLSRHPNVPPDPKPWQGIWSQTTFPKIDSFCWLLCYHRILTEDRLQKRGFIGPSRCSLCGEHEENASHMMLFCKFVVDLWKEALSPWSTDFAPPNHCSKLFSNWKCMYPGGTAQNPHIKEAWLALSKLICWHIWLERNQ
eukprot:PITA_13197